MIHHYNVEYNSLINKIHDYSDGLVPCQHVFKKFHCRNQTLVFTTVHVQEFPFLSQLPSTASMAQWNYSPWGKSQLEHE